MDLDETDGPNNTKELEGVRATLAEEVVPGFAGKDAVEDELVAKSVLWVWVRPMRWIMLMLDLP